MPNVTIVDGTHWAPNPWVPGDRATTGRGPRTGEPRLSKTPSTELLPHGVRFKAVRLRPTKTPLWKLAVANKYRGQIDSEITAGIPAGRFATSDDIAQAVVYLASDESSWTLGAEIVIGGGRLPNG